jgi:hypothetical protein
VIIYRQLRLSITNTSSGSIAVLKAGLVPKRWGVAVKIKLVLNKPILYEKLVQSGTKKIRKS